MNNKKGLLKRASILSLGLVGVCTLGLLVNQDDEAKASNLRRITGAIGRATTNINRSNSVRQGYLGRVGNGERLGHSHAVAQSIQDNRQDNTRTSSNSRTRRVTNVNLPTSTTSSLTQRVQEEGITGRQPSLVGLVSERGITGIRTGRVNSNRDGLVSGNDEARARHNNRILSQREEENSPARQQRNNNILMEWEDDFDNNRNAEVRSQASISEEVNLLLDKEIEMGLTQSEKVRLSNLLGDDYFGEEDFDNNQNIGTHSRDINSHMTQEEEISSLMDKASTEGLRADERSRLSQLTGISEEELTLQQSTLEGLQLERNQEYVVRDIGSENIDRTAEELRLNYLIEGHHNKTLTEEETMELSDIVGEFNIHTQTSQQQSGRAYREQLVRQVEENGGMAVGGRRLNINRVEAVHHNTVERWGSMEFDPAAAGHQTQKLNEDGTVTTIVHGNNGQVVRVSTVDQNHQELFTSQRNGAEWTTVNHTRGDI